MDRLFGSRSGGTVFFIDIGGSFHNLGAAQENALCPCFVCVVDTVNRDVLVDLSQDDRPTLNGQCSLRKGSNAF